MSSSDNEQKPIQPRSVEQRSMRLLVSDGGTARDDHESVARSRTGAQVVVDTLDRLGVRHIFGIPGGNVIPIFDALHTATSVRTVLVRHEEGAVHAAHGYASVTGDVGVCIATSGPGATNLVTGVADAYADSSPILVLTGAVFSYLQGTDAFQDADIAGILASVTKHSYRVTCADDIASTLADAHRIARSGRPGPVLVDITKDAQQGLESQSTGSTQPRIIRRAAAPPQTPDVSRAARELDTSVRPVLVVGTGAIRAHATTEIAALAEHLDAPVFTSQAAHGLLPHGHPSAFGIVEGKRAANALSVCDLALLIGTGASRNHVLSAQMPTSAVVIEVDIDAAELGHDPRFLALLGDAKAVASELLRHCRPRASSNQSWHRNATLFDADPWQTNPRIPAALTAISRASRGDSVIFSEYPAQAGLPVTAIEVSATSQFRTSGGYVRSGFAIPAAMGAKIAMPSRHVWAITDNAGFAISARELATATIESAPVKVAILSSTGQPACTSDVPNALRLAEAYGATTIRITDQRDLGSAMERALKQNRQSVVIEIHLL